MLVPWVGKMFGSHTLAPEGSTSSWPCALGRGDPLENKKDRHGEADRDMETELYRA